MANSSVVGLLKVLLTADTAQFEKGLTGADASVVRLANTMKRDLVPSQTAVNKLVRNFLGTKEIGDAREYAIAVHKIGGAANLTAADQVKVNRAVSDAILHYRTIGKEAPQWMKKLAADTKQVQIQTDNLGGGIESLLGRAKMLAGVFGVTLSAGALVSVAKRAFEAADAIGDLALKMGVSTDAAQRFQFAARQSGAEIEDVTRALVQMNDRLAEGDKGTITALTAVGLKFDELRAMKPEDAFRAIVDAIEKIPDPMRQTQVAMELFGKAGAEILAMIREGSLRVADGMTIMEKETVARLKAANQAWQDFWDRVTITTANAMPKIMDEMADMIAAVKFVARVLDEMSRSGRPDVAVGVALAKGLEETSADLRKAADARRKLKDLMTDPASMSSHGPKAPKILTADEEAALKRAGDAAKKAEEAYQAYRRGALGLSDALKEQLGWEIRLIHEELKRGNGLPAIISAQFKVNQGLEGITARMPNYISFLNITGALEKKKSEDLKHIAEAFKTMTGLVNKTPTSVLLRGGITGKEIDKTGDAARTSAAIDALNRKLGITSDLLRAVGQAGTGAFRTVMSWVSGATDAVFQYIVAAKAAKAANDATAASAAAAGLAMAAATMGISAIVGGIVEALASTAAANKEFKELTAALLELGATPVNTAWTRGQIQPLRDQLATLEKLSEKVKAAFGSLGTSLQNFGGVAPKALHGLIKELLTSKHLTADMRKELEAMTGAPTWQVMQERAEKLGIALGALGSNFSQARISDIALQYVRDLTMFSDQSADMTEVLRGMADELSMVAQEAITSGAALPKTLEPYMKRLAEMGLLLDANGQLIDMGALSFKDIEDEALKQMVSFLEEIRDLLKEIGRISIGAPQVPVTAFGGGVAPRIPRFSSPFDAGIDSAQLPSFAGGTHGAYMDFGPGTPVMLHGQERVSTRGESSGGTFNIYAIDAPSFETFLKQRGGAEAVVRSLPPVVERWGGAR